MKGCILVLIIAAQALLSSTAHGRIFTILPNGVKQIPSTTQVEVKYKQVTWDSAWAELQYSTTTTFAVILSTQPLGFVGRTAGVTYMDTMSVPSGLVGYVRIVSWDSSGRRDTSAYQIMLRKPSVAVVFDSTTDGFVQRITLDAGNDIGAKFYSKVFWAPTYTSVWDFDSLVTGMPIGTTVTIDDTARYLPHPTYYRVKNYIVTGFGTDTVTINGDVRTPVLYPTIAAVGSLTMTSSSAMAHVAVNVFGSPSGNRLVLYWRNTLAGLPFDSSVITPAPTLGVQDFYPVVYGLSPRDTVYMTGKVTNSIGTTFLAPALMGVADSAFTVNMASGTMTLGHDTLRAKATYSIMGSSTATVVVTLAHNTPDNIVGAQPYSYRTHSGSVTPGFVISDTGMYYISVSGIDSPGRMYVEGRDTLSYYVGSVVLDSFAASPATVPVGGTSLLYWKTKYAKKVTIGGGTIVGDKPLSGSASTGILRATTAYVITVEGIDGRVLYDTVTVTVSAPIDSSHLEVARLQKPTTNVYPNPAHDAITITVSDPEGVSYGIQTLLGQKITERAMQTGATVHSLDGYPKGIYILTITRRGEQIDAKRIVVQ